MAGTYAKTRFALRSIANAGASRRQGSAQVLRALCKTNSSMIRKSGYRLFRKDPAQSKTWSAIMNSIENDRDLGGVRLTGPVMHAALNQRNDFGPSPSVAMR